MKHQICCLSLISSLLSNTSPAHCQGESADPAIEVQVTNSSGTTRIIAKPKSVMIVSFTATSTVLLLRSFSFSAGDLSKNRHRRQHQELVLQADTAETGAIYLKTHRYAIIGLYSS